MIDSSETSPELLRLRSSLFNIQYFLQHSDPGVNRQLVDEAVKRLWQQWDKLDAQEAGR